MQLLTLSLFASEESNLKASKSLFAHVAMLQRQQLLQLTLPRGRRKRGKADGSERWLEDKSIEWGWDRWGETLALHKGRFKTSVLAVQGRELVFFALLILFQYHSLQFIRGFKSFLSLQSLTAVSERLWEAEAQFRNGVVIMSPACDNLLPSINFTALVQVDLTSMWTPPEALPRADCFFLTDSLFWFVEMGFPLQRVSWLSLPKTYGAHDQR